MCKSILHLHTLLPFILHLGDIGPSMDCTGRPDRSPLHGGLMVSIYPQDLVDIDKTAEKNWWILTNPGNKFGGGRCKTYIRNQICRR